MVFPLRKKYPECQFVCVCVLHVLQLDSFVIEEEIDTLTLYCFRLPKGDCSWSTGRRCCGVRYYRPDYIQVNETAISVLSEREGNKQ